MFLDTHNDIPSAGQRTEVFLALRPPRPVADRLHAEGRRLYSAAGVGDNRRPSSVLHVTLFSLGGCRGRIPREVLEDIDAAISMMQFPAVTVVLDEAGSFETRAPSVPFVLKGADLPDVQVLRLFARDALLVRCFKIAVHKSYTPHATLAYSPHRAPNMKVEPFSWKAREFYLIESWVGRTKHVELARWALRDDDARQAAA